MARRTILGWGLCLVLLAGSTAATAQTMKRIVMPGEVIGGHAKYENECERCHKPFSKTIQDDLCLKCHKRVGADIRAKKGYHGRNPGTAKKSCRTCHTEHKGRTADVIVFDREIFDHRWTDFKLEGRHRRAGCASCHKTGLLTAEGAKAVKDYGSALPLKYRFAPSACRSCHKDNEPHKGRLGKDCGKCHNAEGWRKTKYDHSKTKFKLEGKHRKTACVGCHPGQRWKNTPKDCYSCHRLNDAHGGIYGKKCEKCHSPAKPATTHLKRFRTTGTITNWNYVIHDHNKPKSKFRLEGRHKQVFCTGCHKKRIDEEKPKPECFACHENSDQHKGRYGKKCETCHEPEGWRKPKYDHDKTDFPLKFKHRKVACDLCHRKPVKTEQAKKKRDKLPVDCYSCHKADEPHGGKQGKRCKRCHSPRGWRELRTFEHDVTRFPLIGLHGVTPCEGCHGSRVFKETPRDCNACHKPDDEHKGTLGTKCNRCHNPNGWAVWRFDHDKDTDFKLREKHKDLACISCHRRAMDDKVKQSMRCVSCHEEDDPHFGGFGRACERCHTEKDFREIKIAH